MADPELARHAQSVASLVTSTVARLTNLSDGERTRIIDAAWLHDIGKLTIARETRSKPGPLSEHEWIEMRAHSSLGADFLDQSSALRPLAVIVRHHHERHDGTGYPNGLSASDIPLGARIVGVADAYDAMISWRPYQPARAEADAVAELHRCSGAQFDPYIVALFLEATAHMRTEDQP
ncbi:MAG: HD domain-containing protein [Thermomicrobiales bacterium]|nr:MAG: HD domain-containing protein [Thermomicrobiales bacterium]